MASRLARHAAGKPLATLDALQTEGKQRADNPSHSRSCETPTFSPIPITPSPYNSIDLKALRQQRSRRRTQEEGSIDPRRAPRVFHRQQDCHPFRRRRYLGLGHQQ